MTAYVALLRGVNLPGVSSLKMVDLKQIAGELRLKRARTYIASGNLLFVSAEPEEKLRRMLERRYFGYTIAQLSSGMNLERSFSPVYARALLRKGQSAFAVLGVNAQEPQAMIDAALSFGILWLDACREVQDGRVVVEGLHVYVPPKSSAMVRERMSRLNANAAKWRLFEFDERHDEVTRSTAGTGATLRHGWFNVQMSSAPTNASRNRSQLSTSWCPSAVLSSYRLPRSRFACMGSNWRGPAWRTLKIHSPAEPKSSLAWAPRSGCSTMATATTSSVCSIAQEKCAMRRDRAIIFVADAS